MQSLRRALGRRFYLTWLNKPTSARARAEGTVRVSNSHRGGIAEGRRHHAGAICVRRGTAVVAKGSLNKTGSADMAHNQLPDENSEALKKKVRRIDIALAIAASILSLGLFYLALFPE